MNKELDKLLCLLDGKITNYRFKNINKKHDTELVLIQQHIQILWIKNKEGNKNGYINRKLWYYIK